MLLSPNASALHAAILDDRVKQLSSGFATATHTNRASKPALTRITIALWGLGQRSQRVMHLTASVLWLSAMLANLRYEATLDALPIILRLDLTRFDQPVAT